ncbi:MAG: exo-beta-N-acetylmuramidase NamZ domain-containing protein, partial [Hoylesella buccalis]
MKKLIALLLLLGTFSTTCWCSTSHVVTGAEQTHLYFPLLKGKKIVLFSNHTGMVGNQHLLDIMVNYRMKVIGVISPEHGFRGTADAGEHVTNSVDAQTGVPIYSLYNGKEGKASLQVLKSADILVVDIQDVGLRFYTYYISMLKLMDACAEVKTPVLVLDRPNPNGFYVDGPILDMKYKSGVGALPIPIVHGMTLGELARMINGEGWLSNQRKCKLTVIPCKNYTHQTRY